MITKTLMTLIFILVGAGLAHAEELLRYDKRAGYEMKPTNISIVLFSDGQLVKSTHNLMENTTTQESIAVLSASRMKNILNKVAAVNSLAPFIDQQEGQPICMDAPSFLYSLSINGKDLLLAKKANCHNYYLQDGVATELVELIQNLVKIASF